MLTPVGHVSAPCPAQVMVLNIHKKLKALRQHSAGVCAALKQLPWHQLAPGLLDATLVLCSVDNTAELSFD